MKDLTIFKNEQFGEVRTAGTSENPLFCLADVCKVLELHSNVVRQRLTKDVCSTYPLKTEGGIQQMTFVNEDGLYDVILDSRKPQAKAFRKWITSEVIPSIRKHGAYMMDGLLDKTLADPDFMIGLLNNLKEERNKRMELQSKNKQLLLEQKENEDKVKFADVCLTSKSSILIGELAKMITQAGRPIGQNRLFRYMRENGYLGTVGEKRNIPNQKYIEQGLFELKKSFYSKDEELLTRLTAKVTEKGQQYFVRKLA